VSGLTGAYCSKRGEFYTANWRYLSGKTDSALIPLISEASLVDECVLSEEVPLSHIGAAKMYRASARQSKKEDHAYCLLGFFDVNMPLLYGEGGKAFLRLQRESINSTYDPSILAWYCADPDDIHTMAWDGRKDLSTVLAPSPRCFKFSGDIWPATSPILCLIGDRLRSMECNGNSVKLWGIVKQTAQHGKSTPSTVLQGDDKYTIVLPCI